MSFTSLVLGPVRRAPTAEFGFKVMDVVDRMDVVCKGTR